MNSSPSIPINQSISANYDKRHPKQTVFDTQ